MGIHLVMNNEGVSEGAIEGANEGANNFKI